MKERERLMKLNAVNAALAEGAMERDACDAAGVSVAWYRRWRERFEEGGYCALANQRRRSW